MKLRWQNYPKAVQILHVKNLKGIVCPSSLETKLGEGCSGFADSYLWRWRHSDSHCFLSWWETSADAVVDPPEHNIIHKQTATEQHISQ